MADQEQLEILKQGVEVWNKWRARNRDVYVDLIGADLREANLRRADLRKTDLTGADLVEANLRGVRLNEAQLNYAKLNFADLSGANLNGTHLIAAELKGADLIEAILAGAVLTEANLTEADLSEANFVGANLVETNLSKANLKGADLSEANLKEANLTRANLNGAYFWRAILRGADLSEADLSGANLKEADLSEADLKEANLREADLRKANFRKANLKGTNLRKANLTEADFMEACLAEADLRGTILVRAGLVSTRIDRAKLSGSSVYAVNVWDLEGKFEEQKDLIITREDDPVITVDNIKVAQFIHLILNNEEIRDLFNTLTSKSVLILGRFAIPERKAILDALRNKLREYDLLPIVFDFDRPTDKDFTETIKTLAGLSYFVIADITNPKSSPLELQATVPDYQIPFVPIIQEGEQPFAMMVDLQKKYNWVLDTLSYSSIETLIKALKPAIIDPAIQKHNELRLIKAREPKIRSANDFIDDKGLDNK